MKQQQFEGLEYKDVYLIPQYSEVNTRSEVDISIKVGHLDVSVPVISANMDTVTNVCMARSMREAGALGALHRFWSIKENVEKYRLVRRTPNQQLDCFVSVGVNRDSKERAQALYEAGARYFIIDIAHGHSKMMRDMMEWMKGTFTDIFLMAGNVATRSGAIALASWGADAVKVGIGPRAVCLTKNVTGVTVPQLGAIEDCAVGLESLSRKVLLVADGGIREYGDVAKAIAAGADLVMAGSLFAGTDEAPGDWVVDGKKVYRGMASEDAMHLIRVDDSCTPTPEGTSILVEHKGPVKRIVDDIAGGLRSAFSYSNARTLSEFQVRAKFGIRKR